MAKCGPRQRVVVGALLSARCGGGGWRRLEIDAWSGNGNGTGAVGHRGLVAVVHGGGTAVVGCRLLRGGVVARAFVYVPSRCGVGTERTPQGINECHPQRNRGGQ